jgi:two-component system, OmpR family, response regulator
MPALPRILIVEDNRSMALALAHALKTDYETEIAPTGKLAIYKTDTLDYDLILLDLGLPDVPGYNVCQQLRERGLATPILVLSAESRTLTKIHLLDAGANDYLTKPFSLGELKARLRRLRRQTTVSPNLSRKLTLGDLVLDRQTFKVSRYGNEISLRRKEFALLEYLIINAGTVVTRRALSAAVWPETEEIWTNTVDVHIKYLRDKIDKPFNTQSIKTVHGIGYKLETSTTKHKSYL